MTAFYAAISCGLILTQLCSLHWAILEVTLHYYRAMASATYGSRLLLCNKISIHNLRTTSEKCIMIMPGLP